MKLNKIIIPLLSIGTVATATSCSCTFNKEELTPLSIDYLDIRDNILYGFKDQYKYKESIEEGNYKLSIPKDVTKLDGAAFGFAIAAISDSPLLIQALDFEKDCACTDLGSSSFNGCSSLKQVIVPPKLNTWGNAIFTGCSNLTKIDLTNINQDVTYTDWYAPANQTWPHSGTITYLKDNNYQKTLANKLLNTINNQEVTSGQPNHWTLETK